MFSAKVGELLPVGVIPTLPKDKFKINLSHFSRTVPLAAPAYTRMKEYVDVWFIPYQLMWKQAGYYLNNLGDQQQRASSLSASVESFDSMPWFSLKEFIEKMSVSKHSNNSFGFDREALSMKLATYLGYPVSSWLTGEGKCLPWTGNEAFDEQLSPFPFCAYQKVSEDHFRFDVWEKASPWTWNLDWVTPSKVRLDLSNDAQYNKVPKTMFDMRYVNNERDMFFGVYPDSQLGDEAVVSVGQSTSSVSDFFSQDANFRNLDGKAVTGDQVYFRKIIDGYGSLKGQGGSTLGKELQLRISAADVSRLRTSLGIGSTTSALNFGVLQLRVAEYLQRYREVLQNGSQDIKSRMKRVWNAEVPSYYSDLSYRVGGYHSDFQINPVTNQNLDAENSVATMQATGNSSENGAFVEFDAEKYGNLPGILLVTYYVRPQLDYSQNRGSLAAKLISKDDFANPAFDRIGMEQVHLLDMVNTPAIYKKVQGVRVEDLFIGYAPRYIKWKTDIDDIVGLFRTKSYSTWSCSISDEYIEKFINIRTSGSNKYLVYDYNLFKVNPSYCNSLWLPQADASFNTDTFLVNFAYDCSAVRSLDYNGMPY